MMNYETTLADSGMDLRSDDAARARKRRMWTIVGIVLVVAIAIVAAFMFAGGADKPAEGAVAKSVPSVTVAVPGRQTVQRVVTATGTLAARRELPVGVAGEGGMISRVLVEPGDWVGAGQVLATIERSVQVQQNRSMVAQTEVARADARIAQAELDRAQALLARGFVSKADIDRKAATRDAANARVSVAIAQSSEMRARTNRLDIRAPAAGLVLTRAAEPGQVVGAGSGVLFRLARGGEMEMLAQLGESDLAQMRVGVPADVTPVGTAQSFRGSVWQTSPVIDPQTRQGIARISLAYNPALRPGGFAGARIVSGAVDAPLLPESAVQSDAKGNFVYIVDAKDVVVRRPVTVGEVSDAGVAIVQGLNGTERVVLSAGAFVNPGDKVKPVRAGARAQAATR